MNRNNLIALGREWHKDTMHRVYFSDLPKWYGLEYSRYNTGNISAASLRGQPISNTKATKLLGVLTYGKVWFDLETEQFGTKDLPQDIAEAIIAAITTAATA